MFRTLSKVCLLLLEVSVEYTNMNSPTKFAFVWDLRPGELKKTID